MKDTHLKCLKALDEGYYGGSGCGDGPAYYHFASICADTRLERQEVRIIVRHLARKGLAVYGKGLWTEENGPAGSGYAITEEGHQLLEGLK